MNDEQLHEQLYDEVGAFAWELCLAFKSMTLEEAAILAEMSVERLQAFVEDWDQNSEIRRQELLASGPFDEVEKKGGAENGEAI